MKKLNIDEIFENEVKTAKQKQKKLEVRQLALERHEERANEKRLSVEQGRNERCKKLAERVTLLFSDLTQSSKKISKGVISSLKKCSETIFMEPTTWDGIPLWKNSSMSRAIVARYIGHVFIPLLDNNKKLQRGVFQVNAYEKGTVSFAGIGKVWVLEEYPSTTLVRAMAKLTKPENLARAIAQQVAQID